MQAGDLAKMAKKRFTGLDGLRGVCALIVAIYHCDLALHTGHLLYRAWLSVDVFFILSGFVITLNYEDRLRAGLGLWGFTKLRARRLTPVHLIGVFTASIAAMAAFAYFGASPSGLWTLVSVMALGMLLIPVTLTPLRDVFARQGEIFPTNPALWSLLGEWIANILYAAFFRTLTRRALVAVAFLIALPLLARTVFHGAWGGGGRYDDYLWGVGRAVLEFLIGVIIYRYQRSNSFARLPSLRPELLYATWFFLTAVPDSVGGAMFSAVLSLAVAPVLVVLLARTEEPVPKYLIWLGAISYPLYASHFAVVNVAAIVLLRHARSANILWIIPMISTAVLIAWVIERLTAQRTASTQTELAAIEPVQS
jgi:peptidoglycan/LPS O-acetylase OafA/YrhL